MWPPLNCFGSCPGKSGPRAFSREWKKQSSSKYLFSFELGTWAQSEMGREKKKKIWLKLNSPARILSGKGASSCERGRGAYLGEVRQTYGAAFPWFSSGTMLHSSPPVYQGKQWSLPMSARWNGPACLTQGLIMEWASTDKG